MRRGLAAALAILMMPSAGATLAECKRSAGGRNPQAANDADPATKRVAVVRAYSRQVPYTVVVDIQEIDAAGRDVKAHGDPRGGHAHRRDIVADAEDWYRYEVPYTSGVRLRIRVEVIPPRTGSGAQCRINDGEWNKDIQDDKGGWRAHCLLVTAR